MSRGNNNIPEELYDYIINTSLRDQPILQKLRDHTGKLSNAGLQISPDQGQFMALLIKLIGATKTLEVGVFTGYSSLIVAQALPDDGKVIAGQAGTFDFAFIDADKEGYPEYYERSLQLLRPKGLIAIDNAFMGGRVADPKATQAGTIIVRKLNADLKDDDRVDVSLLSISDGLYLACKR